MDAIDRNSPLPLWAQVLDDLRARLDDGDIAGDFPTDVELTRHYQVSRHTAREAVRRLQDEGVVSRERGRGTFVTQPAIDQGTGAIYSLFRSIEDRGLEQRSSVLDLGRVRDAAVAARLDLPATTDLVRLERLRLADGQALAHDTAWLPADLAAPLLQLDFSHTALYDELQRTCGVRPTGGHEHISAELPSVEERDLLDIPARQPVFRITRLSEADGRRVEFRRTVVRGDRYRFVANWSAGGGYEANLTTND